jgi:WD40 repeat protein
MTRILRKAYLACGLTLALGCGGESGPSGFDVAEIVVEPDPIVVAQNGSVQVSVSALDDDGALLTGVPVTFWSGDSALVLVGATGIVSSLGPAGSSTIFVKAGNRTEQVPVTVSAVSSAVTLAPDPGVLPQLGTLQMQAALLDVTGAPVPGATFTFVSSDPAIATVSPSGLVTSVGPAGQVLISASSGGLTGQATLAVTQVATTIAVSPNPVLIAPDGSVALQTAVTDAVGAPIAGAVATYTVTSGPLTVSNAGVISCPAGSPLGSGSITVASGNLSTQVAVEIVAAAHPEGILQTTTPFSGAAYGVAVSRTGVVWVVGIEGQLGRGALPGTSFVMSSTGTGTSIGVAFDPGGATAYITGAPSDGVGEFSASSGLPLRSIPGLIGTPFDVKTSPDGSRIYVSTAEGKVYFIEQSSFTVIDEVSIGGGPAVHLAVHQSQPLIYASSPGLPDVVEINTVTKLQRRFAVGGSPQAIGLTPDGTRLYVANEFSGRFNYITLASGAISAPIATCSSYGLSVSPDGLRVLLSCPGDGEVRVYETSGHTEVNRVTGLGAVRRIAHSPNGLLAIVANEGGSVHFIR